MWGEWLGVFGLAVASALVPLINIEAILVLAASEGQVPAWLLVVGWPRLTSQERLMRIAVVALALAITITQAIPR